MDGPLASDRVLVVNDDLWNRLGLDAGLRIAGHDVVSAVDGEQVLRLASQGGFDVIILGLILPFKDGLTVCEELRDSGVETPIAMAAASQHPCREVEVSRSAAILQLGRRTEPPLACDGRELHYVIPGSGSSGLPGARGLSRFDRGPALAVVARNNLHLNMLAYVALEPIPNGCRELRPLHFR